MRASILMLAVASLASLGHAFDQAACPDGLDCQTPASLSPFGRHTSDQAYHVQVKHFDIVILPGEQGCLPCQARPPCDGCVSLVQPVSGTPPLTSPFIATATPSPGAVDQNTTVLILLPCTEDSAHMTMVVPNPGINAPITRTVGTENGGTPTTLVVETPLGLPPLSIGSTCAADIEGLLETPIIGTPAIPLGTHAPALANPVALTLPYTGSSPMDGAFTLTIPAVGATPGTVIIQTPAGLNLDTNTSLYTGTSAVFGPVASLVPPLGITTDDADSQVPPAYVTSTIVDTVPPFVTVPTTRTEVLPVGTTPGIVVVEIPPGSVDSFTDDLAPPSTEPATETILSQGTVPSTTIMEVPTSRNDTVNSDPVPTTAELSPSYVTTTVEYSGSGTITEPITTTVPPSATVPGTVIIQTPQPTFDCDAGGYLLQRRTLYRLDLRTGENRLVRENLGPGPPLNAAGYNVVDDFIYAIAFANSRSQLVRIDSDGGSVALPLVINFGPNGLNCGEVDDNGQFWVSSGGGRWFQINLDPARANYGRVVNDGTSTGVTGLGDWAYIETGGSNLYSIRMVGADAVAVRWSTVSHTWTTLRNFGRINGVTNRLFGALYTVGDEIWGSDNNSGDIIAFPVLSSTAPARKISDGPRTTENDGARCYRAPVPPAAGP